MTRDALRQLLTDEVVCRIFDPFIDGTYDCDGVRERLLAALTPAGDDNARCGRCGHDALWHANIGRNDCQVPEGCAAGCHEFKAPIHAPAPARETNEDEDDEYEAWKRTRTPGTSEAIAKALRDGDFHSHWKNERLVEACAPYLKDGETPAECIERNRKDIDTLLGQLAKEKQKHESPASAVCQHCGGRGWYEGPSEHHPNCDGECHECPDQSQVRCDCENGQ